MAGIRQLFVDTETTGLDPKAGHRIIEIGCVEMIDRRLTGETFHVYINPKREIDRGAQEVHGITTDFLRDKPQFAEIVDKLIQFIHGAQLVIHNAPFDLGFLDSELKKAKKRSTTHYCKDVVDSLVLARRKHPGQRNSLDALCRRYQVDHSHREWHGALLDAELLAGVYLMMTSGQGQLFDEDDFGVLNASVSTEVNVELGATTAMGRHNDALPIIKANKKEIEAHCAYLQKMREKGACVWDTAFELD